MKYVNYEFPLKKYFAEQTSCKRTKIHGFHITSVTCKNAKTSTNGMSQYF